MPPGLAVSIPNQWRIPCLRWCHTVLHRLQNKVKANGSHGRAFCEPRAFYRHEKKKEEKCMRKPRLAHVVPPPIIFCQGRRYLNVVSHMLRHWTVGQFESVAATVVLGTSYFSIGIKMDRAKHKCHIEMNYFPLYMTLFARPLLQGWTLHRVKLGEKVFLGESCCCYQRRRKSIVGRSSVQYTEH